MSIDTQLTVVGVSGENGQPALLNVVEQEPKPGQGLVLTLLQLLRARIVLEANQILSHVMAILVHVSLNLVQASLKPCQASFKPCSGEF